MPIASRAARRSTRGALRLPALLFALLVGGWMLPGAAGAQADGHDHHATRPAQSGAKVKAHHPEPRPGITAADVLAAERVPSRAREAYTIAARIPQVLDGVYCHCDCHERDGLRSLLDCFTNEMAGTCGICQAEARLVSQLHAEGKSLDEIRAAVDADWGG